jgi:ribosome biogenesis protein ENP2
MSGGLHMGNKNVFDKHVLLPFQVKTMANPFAYDEYRKDKIRQKIEESRAQRVQIQVRH